MNRIIRRADCPEVAWKNGGGTTREIAVFPPGAGMDDFLWRLSMARVEQAGAFSAFAGVDRVLAVLEGVLRLSGPAIDTRLDIYSDPRGFPGDTAIMGEPVDGPVLDLNAMARRGRYRIDMRRFAAWTTVEGGEATFLVALEPQRIGSEAVDRLDAAHIPEGWVLEGAALIVRFAPDENATTI